MQKLFKKKVDIDRSKLVDGFAFVQKKLITLLRVAKKKYPSKVLVQLKHE